MEITDWLATGQGALDRIDAKVAAKEAFEKQVSGLLARVEALEKKVEGISNEFETCYQKEWKRVQKLFGNTYTCDDPPEPKPVPPLPEHPKFRTKNGIAQFDTAPTAYGEWVPIFCLIPQQLESCCAIARCWWLDQARDMPTDNTQACIHAEQWRDYYVER